MGTFDWRNALLYGSAELRRQQEKRREYERQDREQASQLYAKMLETGVDPSVLQIDPRVFGEQMRQALEKWGRYMPEATRKRAAQEFADWEAKYAAQKQYDLLYSPTLHKPSDPYEGYTESIKSVMQHYNITPDEWKAMSEAERKIRTQDYYDMRRKEKTTERRDRKQVVTDSLGRKWLYNLDTEESKLLEGLSPEEISMKAEKIERENKKLASDSYKRLINNIEIVKENPSLIDNENEILAGTGWKIIPVYEEPGRLGRLVGADKDIKTVQLKRTFNDNDIAVTAKKTNKKPEEVKAILEAKGFVYEPAW